MARLVAVLVSLVVPGSVFAQVTVEVVQNGNVSSDPPEARILTVREPRRPPPPQPVIVTVADPVVVHDVVEVYHYPTDYYDTEDPGDEIDEMGWTSTLLSFEAIDLSGLDLVFEDTEVALLDGQALAHPDSLEGAWRIGGGIGASAELNDWLRIPEVRLSIGGGQLNGTSTPAADGALSVSAQSFISLHAELAGGVYHRFGPFVPFFLGRIGYAGYFVDVAVESPALGPLGSETVMDGAFEAGIETGIGLELDDEIRATIAYRGTFTGAPAHGVVLGFSLGYGD